MVAAENIFGILEWLARSEELGQRIAVEKAGCGA
jgi:hypothetical protein